MSSYQMQIIQDVKAPQDVMWAVMTDHARWADWLPGEKVIVDPVGSPDPNGLGAVRTFVLKRGRSAAKEEVVGWEPPVSMTYILHSSFPTRNYRSTMTLGAISDGDTDGGGGSADGSADCRLVWESTWESPLPVWFGGALVKKLLFGLLSKAAKKMSAAAERETKIG